MHGAPAGLRIRRRQSLSLNNRLRTDQPRPGQAVRDENSGIFRLYQLEAIEFGRDPVPFLTFRGSTSPADPGHRR